MIRMIGRIVLFPVWLVRQGLGGFSAVMSGLFAVLALIGRFAFKRFPVLLIGIAAGVFLGKKFFYKRNS